MTKTLQNSGQEDCRSRKRILKPVVEKKRRDRINHSLAELRTLLLNSTSNPRLQNPKIEKAEILDLTVEYLHKWTTGANDGPKIKQAPEVSPPHSEPSVFTMENAGFKQCVFELASYMHKITPAQRVSLIEGLKWHTETQPPPRNPDLEQRLGHNPAPLDSSYSSDKKEDSIKFPFLSHSFSRSPHCSTPLQDYLSPPHSPWFSPLSSYSTSPPFVSYTCHFTFPPTPPSCSSSLSTLPAPVSFTPSTGQHMPLQPPPRGVLIDPHQCGGPGKDYTAWTKTIMAANEWKSVANALCTV
uniref:BHLH domain-containing protein n=1 Tax=Neogobius melanostomus TaxID=47308 RepID=A0A8C6T031_9GOBI